MIFSISLSYYNHYVLQRYSSWWLTQICGICGKDVLNGASLSMEITATEDQAEKEAQILSYMWQLLSANQAMVVQLIVPTAGDGWAFKKPQTYLLCQEEQGVLWKLLHSFSPPNDSARGWIMLGRIRTSTALCKAQLFASVLTTNLWNEQSCMLMQAKSPWLLLLKSAYYLEIK